MAIIKYQISNIKLKNQKSRKGRIKERRTAYFCHFSTDFFNFSTIFQHSFQRKASFPQKSAVLRANTLYWKKYGYCWKLKFSTSAAYAQRRAFLKMRLKYFWLYTSESEPTAWTRKSLIAAGTYVRKWKRLIGKNTAPRRRTGGEPSGARAPPTQKKGENPRFCYWQAALQSFIITSVLFII